MNQLIKKISPETLAQYGYLIRHSADRDENFQVILCENDAVGWRIAVSKTSVSQVRKLARHPNSMESFEPISGVPLLCVALPEAPEDYEVFLLDQPVCLYRNIWHCLFTLSEFSVVKICENAVMQSEEYYLNSEIRIAVINKPLN